MHTVQTMINAPNYKENMPQIVKTILEFAFLTYSGMFEPSKSLTYNHIPDLPKGPIKGNSMRKLAAKVGQPPTGSCAVVISVTT